MVKKSLIKQLFQSYRKSSFTILILDAITKKAFFF